MPLFGAKRVRCPAGVWTKIISNFGRGYPREFRVSFSADDNQDVTGVFKEKRSLWILPQEPVEGGSVQNLSHIL